MENKTHLIPIDYNPFEKESYNPFEYKNVKEEGVNIPIRHIGVIGDRAWLDLFHESIPQVEHGIIIANRSFYEARQLPCNFKVQMIDFKKIKKCFSYKKHAKIKLKNRHRKRVVFG